MQSENAKPWSWKPNVAAGKADSVTRSVREPSCAEGSGRGRTIASISHTSQVQRRSLQSIIHISHASGFDYGKNYPYNNTYMASSLMAQDVCVPTDTIGGFLHGGTGKTSAPNPRSVRNAPRNGLTASA